MKQLLLLSVILIASFSVNGQNNAPVAVDDTLEIFYEQVNHGTIGDTSEFRLSINVRANDYDPDGNSISLDSAVIIGSSPNYVTGISANGNLIFIDYHVINEFTGVDSMQYIISDNGSPSMSDTGILYLMVRQKDVEFLEANNINAKIGTMSLFNSRYASHFEVPAGSGLTSIFGANLWLAGKANNMIHSSSKIWGWRSDQQGGFVKESNSGPVSNSSSQYVKYDERWDRVWKVTQYEIDFHLANWTNANYNPPSALLNWPAHGDTTIGEAYYLAPFIDYDNDGNYNPYAGDYPVIKGDQAIYFIYNDGGSVISLNPMKSEIHGMAYAFSCQDSALQNTIFVDYRVINRSNNTYDSTYMGMWADLDLGNAQDDYMQCDVDRGLFFAFNGDDFDDDNSGRPGYGIHPAAQAVMILKGAKQDDDGQDNTFGIGVNETVNGTGFGDGITDNEFWGMEHFVYYNNSSPSIPTSGPQNDGDFYNYLKGYWKDGAHMIYGGTGHPNSSGATTIPAKYMFPDNSDTYNYGTGGVAVPAWNEVTAGNTPADRRGVGSTGPVTFAPGDVIELTYAFVFGRDYVNTGAQAGVTNMLERADSIRSYYDQGMLSACGFPLSVKSEAKTKNDFVVYPNPTQNLIHIEQQTARNIKIEVIDATGKLVFTTKTQNQRTTIDLSGYTNGLYFIKVSSDEGFQVTKVIKK